MRYEHPTDNQQLTKSDRRLPISRPLLAGLLLLLGWGLLAYGWPVTAQAQATAYWQYSAASTMRQVITVDLRGDGVDDILIITQNGQIDLLTADGLRQWSFNVGEPVYTTAVLHEGTAQSEIVLGVTNRLLVLDNEGQLAAEIPLSLAPVPLSLLTSGHIGSAQSWLDQRQAQPLAVSRYQVNDGRQDILVLLQNGQLHRYERNGRFLWSHQEPGIASGDASLKLLVDDMDNNGQDEILLGFFDNRLRFSRVVLLDSAGQTAWSQSISGRLTALTFVQFEPDPILPGPTPQRHLAIGNSQGQVLLYSKNQSRLWPRTINRPVTALSAVPLNDGQALAVANDVGSVILFDENGRRLWTTNLAADANRRILALSAPPLPPLPGRPALAALLASATDTQSADMVLLDADGRILGESASVDALSPFSRLLDVNRDRHSEMLLLRFPTIELTGLGIGASDNAREWEYSLGTRPTAQLIADLDRDGEDDLLVGGEDGRLHRLRNAPTSSGLHRWVTDFDLPITHLALLTHGSGSPDIIVVRYQEGEGRLERRRSDSHMLWQQPLLEPITSLLISSTGADSQPEILLGTASGTVIAYGSNGERIWSVGMGQQQSEAINQLLLLPQPDPQGARLVLASGDQLLKLRHLSQNPQVNEIMRFDAPIVQVHHVAQRYGELEVAYLVLLENGRIHGLNWRGIELTHLGWPFTLSASPTISQPALDLPFESVDLATIAATSSRQSFLIATANDRLQRFNLNDSQPDVSWHLTGLGQITSLFWKDLDGDSRPDLAIGNSQGKVRLYKDVQSPLPLLYNEIDLFSSIQAIGTLQRRPTQRDDLLIINENGLIQLFRTQENRPPLLTKPTAEAGAAQYSISVSVLDVEQDGVDVRLELYDPDGQGWLAQETRRTRDGRGELFWSIVNPPETAGGVRYRFFFDDGVHQGYMQPPAGPAPVRPVGLWQNMPALLLFIGVAGAVMIVVFMRQTQTPTTQANRFFRRLQQTPQRTLTLLAHKYEQTGGSPDFLLSLANRARQESAWLVASLADGLFLLADRPQAGLSIITSVLDEARTQQPPWDELERWQSIYHTAHKLLDAPTVTELSLLQPELAHMLTAVDEQDAPESALSRLLPVLTSLRDSERVELFEDRLVYLNEAAARLQRLQERAELWPLNMERRLAATIARRWSGLISAEVEEIRGRADVMVRLKTKRLVPNGRTDVSLEIYNNGRAPAENLLIALDENPAYTVHSVPQAIPILPSGRSRQVNFVIEPQVSDRFRLALSLTYDDRNQRDIQTAFGDMVHLLPPVRDFRPIVNPYVPGTPLRQNSSLFYGREQLFKFIAENAGRVAQRNILILVGQRRTGKTSALLRLSHYLPEHLVPVYIDCQSLGVTPGMPALFHELAWQISDSLAQQDIEVEIPPLVDWEHNPTAVLERHFLPLVRDKMPEPMMLLLVFDEFEAFENLVEDGILPPTLFPYLRHLMQHSERLSFMFVGTRRLEEMSADYWSVLFNIALYQRIGYLGEEAATRLVLEPVAPDLIYDDLALDKVLRVTAGHPYFLQLVCYTLVKRANAQRSGYVTISDVNATLDEMLSLGEVHFAYLWQRSSHTERALLTAVSQLMDRHTTFHPEDLIQYLAPYDFKLEPAEVTAALNRLVERDIMREVPEGVTTLYELRIGLVGLWTAKNKSLSRLYAQ